MPQISITRPNGDEFDAGVIYAFILSGQSTDRMRIGFAATRNVASSLRYDRSPARLPIEHMTVGATTCANLKEKKNGQSSGA